MCNLPIGGRVVYRVTGKSSVIGNRYVTGIGGLVPSGVSFGPSLVVGLPG